MRYSIIDRATAETYGILPMFHRQLKSGKIVVNENELQRIDHDVSKAAETLGGELLTEEQVMNEILKDYE